MDLDTNVKKLSKELWVKIICVILSIVTFATSAGFAFSAFRGIEFYGEEKAFSKSYEELSYTESLAFYATFCKNVTSVQTAILYDDSDKILLKNQKEKIVSEAVKKFVSAKSQYDKLKEQESNVESDSTGATKSHKDYYIYQIGSEGISFEKKILINENKYYFSTDISFDNYKDENAAKKYIEKQYDEFVKSEASQLLEQKQTAQEDIEEFKNFKFLVVDKSGKTLLTNLNKGQSEEDILNYGINFTSKNGKISSNNPDIFDKPENSGSYASYSNLAFPKGVTAYFAIDTSFKTTDDYSLMNDYAKELKSTSLKKQIIAAVVALICSIIFAIFAFANSGKNNNGTPKLAFIDYVPLDIHFVISGALIAGVIYLGVILGFTQNDYIEYYSNEFRQYSSLLIAAIIGTAWALLLEYICSVIRISRVKGKSFWKSILGVYLVYKLAKVIKLGICKAKKNLSYTPQNYKKNIVKVSVLLLFAELLFVAFGLLFAFVFWPLGVLIGLGFIVFNVFVYVKLLKYFIKLDEIITSAKEKTELEQQLDLLPQSLKILAECLKYSNDELGVAVARAVKDERLKTQLITNVSHDLKTPLTSIITYVDLLSKCDIDDEKAKEYIGVLDEKGKKLKRLIEDLVEASKLSSGNVSVNITKLNLTELAAQAVGENQMEFEKARLNLVMEDKSEGVIVDADGSKTFRIMENLLSNAQKYSAISSRVYVAVYKENGHGVFEIKNISAQPLNISPDELTERFVRGDSSRTKEGNGLGLSIAKELCKAQNATLKITIDGDLFKVKVIF